MRNNDFSKRKEEIIQFLNQIEEELSKEEYVYSEEVDQQIADAMVNLGEDLESNKDMFDYIKRKIYEDNQLKDDINSMLLAKAEVLLKVYKEKEDETEKKHLPLGSSRDSTEHFSGETPDSINKELLKDVIREMIREEMLD